MIDRRLNAEFGLKYHPFTQDIPVENIWCPPALEIFISRMKYLVYRGGYAMISGEPGIGKSKSLQALASKLSEENDILVGVMTRPQSKLYDFYRELGDVFGVNLRPANRYGGFKALRHRWKEHLNTTLYRPVLLIDEAQEMPTVCLNELRILSSEEFDSQNLLTIVVSGDQRLPERFRSPELLALGSRIRIRYTIKPYSPEELLAFINHSLEKAGGTHLMTKELKMTLSEHVGGNLRVLCSLASELLDMAHEKRLSQLDEKLFLEGYSSRPGVSKSRRRKAPQTR